MSGTSMKLELQLPMGNSSMRAIDRLIECLIDCLFAWLLDWLERKGKLFTNFNFFEVFYRDVLHKGREKSGFNTSIALSINQPINSLINQSIDRMGKQLRTSNQSINGLTCLAWYHAWNTNGGLSTSSMPSQNFHFPYPKIRFCIQDDALIRSGSNSNRGHLVGN